jgi:hypothetical protein
VSKCSTEEFDVLSVSARECAEFVQGPSSVTVVCPDLLKPKVGQLQGDPMARQVAPGLVDL